MKLLDPTQTSEAEAPGGSDSPKAPRRYKVIARGEFIHMTPAHKRYVTRTGEGSSLRTAATDALDKLLKAEDIKALRRKLPLKVIFQTGD